MTQWIVTCDASKARVYSRELPNGALQRVLEIHNPKGRARASELASDEPGRVVKNGNSLRGGISAADPRTDPHEVEVEHHAHHLAKILQGGLNQRKYNSLGLIAPPHLLGELRNLLSAEIHKKLKFSVATDLADFTDRELSRRLIELHL